jgi:hypothetical protein
MTPHLPLDATHERIAELHAIAASTHATDARATPMGAAVGRLDRARDALGLRLIELGAALVREEHRPHRLARR